MNTSQHSHGRRVRRRFQFSVRTLLWTMLIVAVCSRLVTPGVALVSTCIEACRERARMQEIADNFEEAIDVIDLSSPRIGGPRPKRVAADGSNSDEHRSNDGMKLERGTEEGMKIDELQQKQRYELPLPGEIELNGPMRIKTYIEGDAA